MQSCDGAQKREGPPLSIFAVIVLYRMRPAQSISYQTLLSALASTRVNGFRLRVLLYDNTPELGRPSDLPDFVRYQPSPVNTGLATAYNVASNLASQQGFTWLLTLDQDTTLPADFFDRLGPIVREQHASANVAAIVPNIKSGTGTLSPYSFVCHTKPVWYPNGFSGIPRRPVYAINSGALIRMTALQDLRGYSELFWLDGSDVDLFRKFERSGKQVFVAGTITLQHDLSLTDMSNKMSAARYSNAIEAGSAFYDMEFGNLVGFCHTLLLVHLYFKQLSDKQSVNLRRLTLSLIGRRLFQSRTRRLRSWLASEEARIASCRAQQGTNT